MDDLHVLVEALGNLKKAYGEEVFEIVNFDYVLKKKEILTWLRPQVERNISNNYIPGFQFKDLNRFGWHLRKEEYFRSTLFGDRMPPKKFANTWVRRFMVPSRFHYIAEVALAFQERAEVSRKHRKRWPDFPVSKGWISLMRDWIEINDTMRGYSRPGLKGMPWSEKYSQVNEETIFRWAKMAKTYRKKRQTSSPRNYWQISFISYNGEELINVDKIFDHVSMIDTRYTEFWKWVGDESEPCPRRKSMSFMLPASLDTWNAPDRKG